MKTLSAEEIKSKVKEGYTKAALSGCGCSGTKETQLLKGNLVKIAGYSKEELSALPDDAVENAFGCGNPTAFAGVMPGQTLVDIGSGAGIDCLLAAQKVGKEGKVIGIDMTPVMIEKAAANARRAGAEHVEFRLGDAEQIPVDSGTADWIISNCVINLAPDKDKVFKEIYRVLRPDGRVSISDIVLGADLPEAIVNDFQALVGCVAGAITESDYLKKMKNAGLRDIFVINRLVYDRSQIGGLMSEEGCCNSGISDVIKQLLPSIEGKVWSAKIIARKPDQDTDNHGGIHIRKAEEQDALFIKSILAESGLPAHDIDPHLKHFYIATMNGSIAGIVGAEIYPPYSILRSLAVRPEFRHQGIARQLTEAVIKEAGQNHIHELYLLTTDAEKYFSVKGFNALSREEVPDILKQHSQFNSCCCGGATVMKKSL